MTTSTGPAPVTADAPAMPKYAGDHVHVQDTGHPKGAVSSHRETFFNCLNADMFFDFVFEDCMLIVFPMFHSGGLFVQAAPSLYKVRPSSFIRVSTLERVLEDIHRYGVTKFLGVPTIYRGLLAVAAGHQGELASLAVCAIRRRTSDSGYHPQVLGRGIPGAAGDGTDGDVDPPVGFRAGTAGSARYRGASGIPRRGEARS